ncbi:uncharacterized protein BDW47DRAFT_87131 [Aspergillus candidus]|uniref:Mid2 domain-containing protein n=1 Tax=Aspergillus candidus TaxID=41067 RepID=A0A2I2EZH4_ASPCN|nr:hypothetical protein BDW47DRAFT_87131 [Aspergillus candidus]PLB33770.1 hypothetical protein BDW47DRAFT_87131 [Aspergillus candidus]
MHINMAPDDIDIATAMTDGDSTEFSWTGSDDFGPDKNEPGVKSTSTDTDTGTRTGTEKTSDGTLPNTAPGLQPTEHKTDGSQLTTQSNPTGQSQPTTSDLNTTSTSKYEANTNDRYPHPTTGTSPGDEEPHNSHPKSITTTTQSSATTTENPIPAEHTLSKPSAKTTTTTFDHPKKTSASKDSSNSVEGKGEGGGGGGGLPTKTKVAIAVPVSIVGALIIAALIYFFLRRRNRQKRNKAAPSTDNLVMSTAASTPAHTQPYPPPFQSPQPHSPAPFAAVPAEPSPRHLNPNINIEPPAAVATKGDRDPVRPTSQLLPTDHSAILVAGAGQQQQQQQQQQPVQHPHSPYHSTGDPIQERNLWSNEAAAGTRPRSPFDHPMDDQLSVMSAMSDRRAHPHDRDDASSVSSVSDDEGERERVRGRG